MCAAGVRDLAIYCFAMAAVAICFDEHDLIRLPFSSIGEILLL